jgi:hypothetical protein
MATTWKQYPQLQNDLSLPTERKLAVALENTPAAQEICNAITDAVAGVASTDVTDHNDISILYIVGDAYTEGSVRLLVIDGIARIEKMVLGAWNLTEFEVSAGTLLLGPNISLSALGEHLAVGSVEGDRHSIITDAAFDDIGSEAPHAAIMGTKQYRMVYQADNALEVLSTTHTNVINTDLGSIAYALYGQLGAVPPTGIIDIEISAGIPPNDVVFFRRLFNTTGAPPFMEVQMDFATGLSFELSKHSGVHTQINVKSEALNGVPWSLMYNAAGTRPWLALDIQPIIFEPLFSMPTGFNRLLSTLEGDTVYDQNGNLIASGAN